MPPAGSSLALASLLTLASTAHRGSVPLETCTLPGIEGDILCGTWPVHSIPLFVAVLPAEGKPKAPDPLFVLAGGPGQGASGLAGFVDQAFPEVRRHRDIVLVDLAGTGRSAPLAC